jgi:hypothetical protein
MYLFIREDTTTPPENPFKLYHYDPSIAGAVVVLLLFLGTTALHFWQLFRARCWFMLPLAIGGICREPTFHLEDTDHHPKTSANQ